MEILKLNKGNTSTFPEDARPLISITKNSVVFNFAASETLHLKLGSEVLLGRMNDEYYISDVSMKDYRKGYVLYKIKKKQSSNANCLRFCTKIILRKSIPLGYYVVTEEIIWNAETNLDWCKIKLINPKL